MPHSDYSSNCQQLPVNDKSMNGATGQVQVSSHRPRIITVTPCNNSAHNFTQTDTGTDCTQDSQFLVSCRHINTTNLATCHHTICVTTLHKVSQTGVNVLRCIRTKTILPDFSEKGHWLESY